LEIEREMSKKAFDKIAEGLREALAVARNQASPADLHQSAPETVPMPPSEPVKDRGPSLT